FFRQRGFQLREQLIHARHHAESGSVAIFQNRKQRTAQPIQTDDVGLRREAIRDGSDIANEDRRPVDDLQREIIHLLRLQRARIEIDIIFKLADLRSTRGKNQILLAERADDIRRGETLCLQKGGIEAYIDFARFSAVRIRDGRAGNSDKLCADLIEANVIEL